MSNVEELRPSKSVNTSGIYPAGDRVLILPDEVQKSYEGVIELPDSVEQQHGMAQSIGVLIAAGPDCWVHSVERDGRGQKISTSGFSQAFAAPGQRVVFAKYGGIQVPGKDGKQYRIMNDIDITALADEGVDFSDLKSRQPFAK